MDEVRQQVPPIVEPRDSKLKSFLDYFRITADLRRRKGIVIPQHNIELDGLAVIECADARVPSNMNRHLKYCAVLGEFDCIGDPLR